MNSQARPAANRFGALWWLASVLVVAGCAVLLFRPMSGAAFRHDDFDWLGVARHWDRAGATLWRSPAGLTVLWNAVFLETYRHAGLDPAPYYDLMMATHALASCAVLWAAWELTRDHLAALLAGLLFAVLWQHHEVVTWIAVGYRPIAMCAMMGSIAAWTRYRRQANAAWRWVAVGFAVLALLTKEDAAALVFLLPLADAWLRRADARHGGSLKTKAWSIDWAPFALVFVVYAVLQAALTNPNGTVHVGRQYWLGPHMLWNLIVCVPQMIVPDLGFENYRDMLGRLGAHPALLAHVHAFCLAAQVLITLVAVYCICRGPSILAFGLAWSYLAFLPFTPFAYDLARAPRYLYGATFGPCLLVGVGGALLWRRWHAPLPRILWCCGLALLLAANAGFIRLVIRNRLRDSVIRRAITKGTLLALPNPAPGSTIELVGVPGYMIDLANGIPLYCKAPVRCIAISAIPNKPWPAKTYVLMCVNGGGGYVVSRVHRGKSAPGATQ